MKDNTNPDEWIFVPSRNKSKLSSAKSPNKRRMRNLEKAKQLHATIHGTNSCDHDESSSASASNEQEKCKNLIATVEHCMSDFDNFLQKQNQKQASFDFEMQALIDSIHDAANAKGPRKLDEIICYGIGNFNSTSLTSRYNAPLIQLACVLILRRNFALASLSENNFDGDNDGDDNDGNDNDGDDNDDDGDNGGRKSGIRNISYEQQQKLVSTVYFEPFILSVERVVLEYFHVKVLDINEHGKRCITRDDKDKSKSNNNNNNNKDASCNKSDSSTFFYMPHCPMRLYSNVLWANWNEELIMNGRIVLFGNSFKAYDERIVSSEQKKDNTNAIFPLLNYAVETPVLLSQGRNNKSNKSSRSQGNGGGVGMSVQDLEMAFNDSSIISFVNDDKLDFPHQPEEYFLEGDSELV